MSDFELFCRVMDLSVGGGIDINDNPLCYEDNEPEGRVRIYWYPDSPVSFFEVRADTISEAMSKLASSPDAIQVAARTERPKAEWIKGQ